MKYVPDKERKKGRNNWFQTDGWRDWSLNGTFKMKFLYIVCIIRDTDTILNQLQVIPVSVGYKMIVQQNCIVYLFIILKLYIMEEHHQLNKYWTD